MFRRKIRVTLITLIPKHTACSISWNWIQQTFTCQYLSSPYLQLWNYKDLISNLMAMSFPKKKIGLSTAAFLPSDTPSCLTWISSTHKSALSWSDARFKKKKKHTQLAGVTSNASDINHEMKPFHNQNDETVKHNYVNMQRQREWFFKKESCKSYTYLLYAYVYDHLFIWCTGILE